MSMQRKKIEDSRETQNSLSTSAKVGLAVTATCASRHLIKYLRYRDGVGYLQNFISM